MSSGGHGHETERFDPTLKSTASKYEAIDIPRVFTSAEEEADFNRFRVLKRRHDIQAKQANNQPLTTADERWLANDPAHRGPLNQQEQQTYSEYVETFGKRVDNFIRKSAHELQESPPEASFEGFAKTVDLEEPDDIEEPEPRPFSVIALEEARILMNRLFGKNHELRTFFEREVVLKYDETQRRTPAEIASDAEAPNPAAGGALVTRGRDKSGQLKYVVTVTDETFLKTVTWHDRQGGAHYYQKPDYLNAVFTIGRAVLQAALTDERIAEFSEKYSRNVKEKASPPPEQWLEGGAEQLIDTQHRGSREQRALDFLALCLFDEKQAQALDKDAFATAKKDFLSKIYWRDDQKHLQGPRHMVESAQFRVEQSRLNLEYLYKDHNPTKRPLNTLGQWGEYSNTKEGLWAKLAAGGIGGFALGMLTGGTGLLAPVIVGASTLAGVAAGKAAYRPLALFRKVQLAYKEQLDFYYELAVSAEEKKELAAFSDREESGGDRMKRLGEALRSGGEETARLVLLSLAKGGNLNTWLVYLYLLDNDKLFQQTGGQEITQKGYNFAMRLHRYSNQAKRIGTVISLYKQEVDAYGRKRYKLRDYDSFQAAINIQWSQRGDREAQNAAVEVFDMMKIGSRFVGLDEKYGQGAHGFEVADNGDLREILGNEVAEHLMHFLGSEWKGDQRFLNKFSAYERGAINRYQKMQAGLFPGAYTRRTAREAFEHYNNIVPELEDELGPREKKATDKLTKEKYRHLLDDDDVSVEDFRQMSRQVDDDKYTGNFGDDEKRITEERTTGRGILNKDLERLNKKFAELEFSPDIQAELLKLGDVVKAQTSNTWNAQENGNPEKAMERIIERVDRILEDKHTDEDEIFKVHTWITQLRAYAPNAHAIDEFRRELNADVKDYARAFANAQNPPSVANGALVNFQLEKLRATAEKSKNTIDTAMLTEKVERIADSIRNNNALPNDYKTMVLAGLDSLVRTSNTPEEFANSAKLLVARIRKKTDDDTKAIPKAKDEFALITGLAADVKQVLRLQKHGIRFEGEAELPSHDELVRRFKQLKAIDPALASRDNLTEKEMFKALKLAGVAVGRVIDQEKKANGKGGGNANTKGGGNKNGKKGQRQGQQDLNQELEIEGDDDDQ